MDKTELNKYSTALGLNLGQLDVDYFQHWILLFLYRLISDELVFKGGTALSKVYGLARFSEDLDFTAVREIELAPLSEKVISGLGLIGHKAVFRNLKDTDTSYSGKMRISGLSYDGSEQSKVTVRLEISKREKVIKKPLPYEITPVYNDIQPYNIVVMSKEEIAAEKIRAVMTRNKARDVYDLSFLFNKPLKLKLSLVNDKLDFYGKTYSFKEFEERLKARKGVWDKEMKYLVRVVPDFDKVVTDLLANVKNKLIS